MESCARGDNTALGDLFDALAPALSAHLARRHACERVDRLVRSVVLELHHARGCYVAGTAVLPWALAIAHRLARRRRPNTRVSSPRIGECSSSSARVLEELDRLPEVTAAAWELISLDKLTPTEAGAVLGLGSAGARAHFDRASAALGDTQVCSTQDDGGPFRRATHPRLQRGAIALSRYRVDRWIGGGAHGDVYLAHDVVRARQVALKVLRDSGDDDDARRTRFQRELEILRAADVPGMVTALDAGTLRDGRACFAMEYVHGSSLAQLLLAHASLPWPRVRAIARQLCETLARVHARGIVHRDLKPANCFVEPSLHGRERVRVLDFGVAKLATCRPRDALTRPGTLVGTPEYMAPEQLRGEAVDGRTDLYALGIMLYELLVGRRPFLGDSLVAIIGQQLFSAPQAPSAAIGDASLRSADDIVLRLLAKDPAQRFASADELARALDDIGEAPARLASVDGARLATRGTLRAPTLLACASAG